MRKNSSPIALFLQEENWVTEIKADKRREIGC